METKVKKAQKIKDGKHTLRRRADQSTDMPTQWEDTPAMITSTGLSAALTNSHIIGRP